MPILVKSDYVRRGRKAKVCRRRHRRRQWVNMRVKIFARKDFVTNSVEARGLLIFKLSESHFNLFNRLESPNSEYKQLLLSKSFFCPVHICEKVISFFYRSFIINCRGRNIIFIPRFKSSPEFIIIFVTNLVIIFLK